jgi:hypothetical protein
MRGQSPTLLQSVQKCCATLFCKQKLAAVWLQQSTLQVGAAAQSVPHGHALLTVHLNLCHCSVHSHCACNQTC